ncbi:MAG TPA: arginine--tRNA ligase [Candidatus Paceibacterota bacterium]|nr:arginine--tRNA ligase [Candidatus Paceibacterota bacterium]
MTIKQEIEKLIREAVRGFGKVGEIPLEHPENPDHGDYATSVAFALAKQLGKNPQEVAKEIASKFDIQNSKFLDKVEVVGGFVNFYLSAKVFEATLQAVLKEEEKFGKGSVLKGKNIMVEYAHPNTHKEMHIGHMRTLVTGEALCRIFEAAGAKVFRANYQGDVGPHVAKAIWGTEKLLAERDTSWEDAEKLSLSEKAHLLGQGYVKGNQEYENSKQEIDALNKKLYQQDKEVAGVYERTRKWSLDYYDSFYKRFDTKFNKLYFESQVAGLGKSIVLKNIGKVFEESQGAIVFKGEQYGLHTRVFVTQDGNPTYEGKEMGLAPTQHKDFPFDLNIHVVANEQAGYFQVVFKALELIDEKFKGKEYHLSMGMVQLVGKKMSSRTGVLVTVDGLLDDVKELLAQLITSEGFTPQEKEEVKETGTVAAVKYSVLKTDTKANVLFDLARSVALDGNSGPYLLYTYARCKSILRKEKASNKQIKISNVAKEELDILRLMYRFPEVVQEAAEKYAPNLVCAFAFDLSQKYNAFYNAHSVLQADTPEQKEFRLQLCAACAQLLQNSLHLLGIQTLEKM